MKRFWDTATLAPQPGNPHGGLGVLLDGKPLRIPGGGPLVFDRPALAAAVLAEWTQAGGGAKGGEMSMAELPLTRLAGTAQERIAADPAPMVEGLAKYAETDLLCYRAADEKLATWQALEWQPLLDWAALQHDAPLRVTTGIMPVPQDPVALAALRRAVAALTPVQLVAMGVLVPAFGSLVLALAVVELHIPATEAHRLAILDETFQEEFWGLDAEAATRRQRIAEDVDVIARLLELSA